MVHYTEIDLTNGKPVCSSYLIGRENENATEAIRLIVPPKYALCKFVFDFRLEDGSSYSSAKIGYSDTGTIEYTLPQHVLRKGALVIGIRAMDSATGFVKRVFERSFVCSENITSEGETLPAELINDLVDQINLLNETGKSHVSVVSEVPEDATNGKVIYAIGQGFLIGNGDQWDVLPETDTKRFIVAESISELSPDLPDGSVAFVTGDSSGSYVSIAFPEHAEEFVVEKNNQPLKLGTPTYKPEAFDSFLSAYQEEFESGDVEFIEISPDSSFNTYRPEFLQHVYRFDSKNESYVDITETLHDGDSLIGFYVAQHSNNLPKPEMHLSNGKKDVHFILAPVVSDFHENPYFSAHCDLGGKEPFRLVESAHYPFFIMVELSDFPSVQYEDECHRLVIEMGLFFFESLEIEGSQVEAGWNILGFREELNGGEWVETDDFLLSCDDIFDYVTIQDDNDFTVQCDAAAQDLLAECLLVSKKSFAGVYVKVESEWKYFGHSEDMQRLSDGLLSRISVVDTLPEDAPDDTAVYLLGDGFYLRVSDQWRRLPQSGSPVIRIVDVYADLTTDAEENELAFVLNSGTTDDDPPEYCPAGFYVFDGTGWAYIGEREIPERVSSLEGLAHAHANKEIIDRFKYIVDYTESFGTIEDAEIGDIALSIKGSWGGPAYDCYPHPGVYVCTDPTASFENRWTALYPKRLLYRLNELAHEHSNKATLDRFSGTDAVRVNGKEIQTVPVDDVELLEQKTYERLFFVSNLEEVPSTLTQANATISLVDGEDFIKLTEDLNPLGIPYRTLFVNIDGSLYIYDSNDGWADNNGDLCEEPVVTNFTVQAVRMYDEAEREFVNYSDFTNLPPNAQEALRMLSMVVHASMNRVDHPYTPQDSLLRYMGTIEPNRKYIYHSSLEQNLNLVLPESPSINEDVQFVMYIDCRFDLDVTFPAGTLFVGGLPDTKAGLHKLIGTWRPDARCWSVGCVTAEAAT